MVDRETGTTTDPDEAGSLKPGTKGSPGLDDNDAANQIPTPEPGTNPLHEGGP